MSNDFYIPDFGDDRENQINEEEYDQWVYEQERKEYIADLQKKFTEYLYDNYSIGNGTQLIAILERGEALENFLADNDLPGDTEIEI